MFKRILNLGDKRNKSKGFRLDDCLLECFASLSIKCKDEELEDLIYFILDLYQYNGLEFSLSDIDIDQVRQHLYGGQLLTSLIPGCRRPSYHS